MTFIIQFEKPVNQELYPRNLMTRQRISSIATKIFAGSFVLLVMGFPQQFKMPVDGAQKKSYSNFKSWGKQYNKGVDIFANKELMFTRQRRDCSI